MKNDSKWIGLLLDSSGFVVINKALIKEIGTNASLMVGELVSEYNYYQKTGTLTNKEWFYSTQENITENTGLTRYAQDESIKKLIELKILETKVMGMPSKKYYKLEFKNLKKVLKNAKKPLKIKVAENSKQGCRNQQTRLSKSTNKVAENSKQGCRNQQTRLSKSTTNNNISNKNKKKNNKTNLILQQEDEMRNTSLFNSFYKNTDIDNILKEHPSYIDIAENVYNIAKNIYLSSKEYEIIGGNKITLNNLKETLNSYDKDKMNYVLESLFYNSNDKIQKLDKYIMATLYNAPRTYALFKSKKANKQMQELNKNIEKHNDTTFIYDFKTFK